MGIFNPQNNLGLEIFFIGTVVMVIFVVIFFLWVSISNHRWNKAKAKL